MSRERVERADHRDPAAVPDDYPHLSDVQTLPAWDQLRQQANERFASSRSAASRPRTERPLDNARYCHSALRRRWDRQRLFQERHSVDQFARDVLPPHHAKRPADQHSVAIPRRRRAPLLLRQHKRVRHVDPSIPLVQFRDLHAIARSLTRSLRHLRRAVTTVKVRRHAWAAMRREPIVVGWITGRALGAVVANGGRSQCRFESRSGALTTVRMTL